MNMPNLIHVDSFQNRNQFGDFYPALYTPLHFFKDARYDSYTRKWSFDVGATYPYICYAHWDHLKENNMFFVDLRRFAERRATGDIIYQKKNMSYKWCYNLYKIKHHWERKYSEISNIYWMFYFECDTDMIMWKLIYPDLMSDTVSKYHPDYDDHDDECCFDMSFDMNE